MSNAVIDIVSPDKALHHCDWMTVSGGPGLCRFRVAAEGRTLLYFYLGSAVGIRGMPKLRELSAGANRAIAARAAKPGRPGIIPLSQ